jgi:L-ascorbate metabolism protein UlaG (beta-lactamase superfamily)
LLPILAANPQARLVVPRANEVFTVERLGGQRERLVPVDAGETVSVGAVRIHAVAAAHNEVERDEHGWSRFLSYVVEVAGVTVFHSGDTLLHDGLVASVRPLAPRIVLVPINGNKPERRVAGNMNGTEAATFARAVGAALAVPHHFDLFEFNTESPELFEAECRRLGQPFRTLRTGEGMEV